MRRNTKTLGRQQDRISVLHGMNPHGVYLYLRAFLDYRV